MKKNEIVSLEITDMTHEGSGLGRCDGMAVFVPETAVGDQVRVRIVKVNKTHCFGRVEHILTPSPDRIPPDCPVSRRCGGCVFRHVTYEAELRYKQRFVEQNLSRIGGLSLECEPILPSPLTEGYRNKAQYPVRFQRGRLRAGFFAPRSHEVVDCRFCRLQPRVFGELVDAVLDFCKKKNVPAYDEQSGTGVLRHIYLRQGAHSGEIMVCLVCNGSFPNAQALVEVLRETAPATVSVLLNINKTNTNVILGPKTRVLSGKPTITDEMHGLQFTLSPHAFYQVNTLAAERLYDLAAEYAGLAGTKTLLDLYCGAGTIGLSMAAKAEKVVGVEIVAQAVENATANANANGITNACFFCGDAGEAASYLAKEGMRPQVVIVDPPRKGCDEKTLAVVAEIEPERIVYISCNSATLARDCAFMEKLGYSAVRCRPVDLFPRTAHVEVVIMMTYCGLDKKNRG